MNWVDNLLAAAGLERCHHCGQRAHAGGLCAACRSRLEANSSCCPRCAFPLSRSVICLECQRRDPPWLSCAVPWTYQDPIRGWLHQAKFHEDLVALRVIRELATQATLPRPDLVCPVPMPATRLAQRGLNVASELARALARKLACPCRQALCSAPGLPQVQLNRAQRLRRRSSFQATDRLHGESVLLVDDVMTTGATLRSATSSLLRAGASEVHAFALLRTPLRPSRSPARAR